MGASDVVKKSLLRGRVEVVTTGRRAFEHPERPGSGGAD